MEHDDIFILVLLGLVLYGLPTIIAGARHHHQGHAIAALNMLLGWTILGWFIALIWALTAVRKTL